MHSCEPLINLMMFADWKDKQQAEEKRQIIGKVDKMRKLQREFFKRRDVQVLKNAKKAEAEVDALIKEINDLQLKLEI